MNMASAREQMKTINEELDRVRAEIDRLKLEEGVLTRLLAKMLGEPTPVAVRKRATSVKPLVLDIIHKAGDAGMTSADVAILVRDRVPDVAKDTVGSVLSRLKSEGAFVYEGERYYERQYAPKGQNPFETLRVVS
jgi:hypothetical protein